MGCTGSTNAMPPTNGYKPLKMDDGREGELPELPSPVAFVVPLNDQEDSLIKKHPPKRFQRLDEQEILPPVLTHKMLQDKLAEAEQRRLQILHERIESAKILMKPGAKHPARLIDMANVPRVINVEG